MRAPLPLLLMATMPALSLAVRRVFVSGAGGQTGQSVFRKMLARPELFQPVGVVRSEARRQELIASGVPPATVVVADVTDAAAVAAAAAGCDAFAICTSAKPSPTGATSEAGRPVFGFPAGNPELVDWLGQKNQIDAAKLAGLDTLVVICSSMGGTDPNHPLNALGRREDLGDGSTRGGDILKWKRKAELYLVESGLPYCIVHPGGLLNEPGGKRELCVGVDDSITGTANRSVPREDVAEVIVQAMLHAGFQKRSFDLVSKPEGDGQVTTDFAQLAASLEGRSCDYTLGEIGGTAK
ncbi:hypothetical protein T492DRAFT_941063 [Pavlovales sp. CCMP2436]|nr:hypothetical protein T492DRAFT_941063 [Pavlovales sp. CCMP2436]